MKIEVKVPQLPESVAEATLVSWHKKAGDAVRRDESGKVVRSRPLCQYPLVARYKGQGSTDEASSFSCKAGF